MTREPVLPPATRTINCVGDLHFGNIPTTRTAKMHVDYGKVTVPSTAHVMMGDLTRDGQTVDDDLAKAWMAQLEGDVYGVVGNHDIEGDIRSPEQAATALGFQARNYTVDLGFVTLVCLFPGDSYAAYNSGSHMSATAMSWLDSTLSSINGDAWIMCHFPLYNTVVGDSSLYWRSIDGGYFVAESGVNHVNSDTVEALLADHPNAKAWVAAHTHSPIEQPGLVVAKTIGGRSFACINASVPYMLAKSASPWSPIRSAYVTHAGDSIKVRYRNHGAQMWDAVNADRVLSIPVG